MGKGHSGRIQKVGTALRRRPLSPQISLAATTFSAMVSPLFDGGPGLDEEENGPSSPFE